MKAFIGHSFDDKDKTLVDTVKEFIESAGIECKTGERAQNSSIAQKVKEHIADCEIFLGIFTCDKPIYQDDKRRFRRSKMKCEGYTTSNWVLQESGFAIGIKRELILLVEKGAYKFPELQGDMEVIYFDKNSIQEQYIKLNQMLDGIKSRITEGAAEPPTKESKQPDSTKPEELERQSKEGMEKDEKDKVLDNLFEALFKDKDYSKAQRIFDEEAEALLDEDDRAPLRAYVLREYHSLGDSNAFDKLQKLAQENEDNPRVIKQLAYYYKDIGEFRKAEETFLLAKDKYNKNDADERKGLVDAYVQVAWCLSLDDKYNDAISMLNKLLFDSALVDQKAKILEAMAKIFKENGEIDSFFAPSEAALDINPSNTSLRFDLAYAYSNNNNEKLALLHYKKLTRNITKHSSGLNNLGVSYGRLNLIGKSAESYLKAADNDGVLAMGNLAHKYLEAGFVNKAREQLERANTLINRETEAQPRVGSAQKKLKDLLESENKQEKTFLTEARKESHYRVRYSKALCSDMNITKDGIDGIWETPWGNGKLNYDESTKSFNIKIQREIDLNLIASLLAPKVGIPRSEPEKKFQNISIEGTFEGLGGKYNIRISEGKEATTLLTGEADATGHLILNDDLNNMSVMEKTKDGKIEFKQWKKQLDAPSPS